MLLGELTVTILPSVLCRLHRLVVMPSMTLLSIGLGSPLNWLFIFDVRQVWVVRRSVARPLPLQLAVLMNDPNCLSSGLEARLLLTRYLQRLRW